MTRDWDELIDLMKTGSIRALTRLITWVENRETGWIEAMKRIYPETGGARLIGITGSPGAGKSTLTNRIVLDLVERGFTVGVIAVDPSSPFSGGAILADRVRMMDVSGLDGVFVRSMATRGALGGLNQSARDVAKLMDAFGKDYIIIETVGVGQDEIEVVRTTDLVLVVCVPGQGDAIQAIKAGIMEIADIFVVNKADRDGADQVVMDIEGMLALGPHPDGRIPPIMKTDAVNNEGVSALVDQAVDLLGSLERETTWQEDRVRDELIGLVEKELVDRIKKNWEQNGGLDQAVKQVLALERDPYSIVQDVLAPLVHIFPGDE
ncbi:MAG: methylmalonyl Co-A mutase-associated GTPase MeaB [Desulfobacterales bacterium]